MLIKETEKPILKDLIWHGKSRLNKEEAFKGDILNNIKIVGSGKGAIALVLKYLSEKNIICNKLDEVMVADWIGYWVYNQIHPYAFPAKKFSNRTKALLVYHQYGFPQDMDAILDFAQDKNLIVIEDCAHALHSFYKGRPLGSMGDFSIYSFSKWFFCFALGGVKSKFDDFHGYVDKTLSDVPFGLTSVKDLSKLIYERSSFSKFHFFKKYASLLMNMSYSLYGEALKPSYLARYLLFNKLEQEVNIRQERYRHFLESVDHLGICDHLERKGITPYIIPICCPENKNIALVEALRSEGIMTGLYYFDINRNFLSPKFKKCIWIPCHGSISDEKFHAIIKLILKKL